jgi:putative ABC transport system permease protein
MYDDPVGDHAVVENDAAFLALSRLLATFLHGGGTTDGLALLAAAAVLMAARLLAAYVPARRASRIDPAVVLREQ